MAPEQLLRGGVVDHRTDLYAAGVVLFELLTGTRLYEAGREPDYRALARKVTRGEHPLPSEIDPALLPYDELVATALRPRPVDRYQSAAELRDAIQQCLVAVNPTISTDQLGSYMRELFADEMNAQRELHARVASAHLSDFQEQFHTQTISTVSFALAHQPLQPPDATGRVARAAQRTPLPVARSRNTGPNPVLGPHGAAPYPELTPPPAQATMAPPTGSLERASLSEQLEPADTIIGMAGLPKGSRDRRRLLVISASAATALLAVFALWGLAARDGEPRPPVTPPIAPPADPRAITVQPIPVEPPKAAVPEEIEMTPDDLPPRGGPLWTGGGSSAVAPSPPHAPREASHKPAHKDPRPPSPPPAVAFTREQLGQKFQQVRREYDDYKSKFGSRLEKEWGDLATYIQYMPASDDDAGLREAARRLEAFRVRMRE